MPAALKIYRPEDETPAGGPRESTRRLIEQLTGGRPLWPAEPAPLTAAWTLDDLFSRYLAPVGLIPAAARPETHRAYRDALAYWRALTGDPILAAITPLTVAAFAAALAEAEPLRKPAAGRRGPRRLAVTTQHRILRTIRALLRAAAADNRRGPALAAIPAPPYVPLPRLRPTPAPAPPLADLARLFRQAPPYWRAALACLFYTGLRPGAVWQLTGADLDLAGPAWHVRPEANTKTGKAYAGPMHPAAARAIGELHPAGLAAADRLLPWTGSRGTLTATWRRLQQAAAVAPFRLRDVRRSHAAAIAAAGIDAATQAAQLALQHHDQRTTAGHYLAVAPLLLALPDLYTLETEPHGRD